MATEKNPTPSTPSTPSDAPSVKMKRRLNLWLSIPVIILLMYMIFGIYKVAIKEGEKWRDLANEQQLSSTVVEASRGTIYDSNGNVLAQSKTVYTFYCDPVMFAEQLKLRDDWIEELRGAIQETDDPEKIAGYEEKLKEAKTSEETYDILVEFLATKLELDTQKVKDMLEDDSSQYVIMKKEVEKTTRDDIYDKLTELHMDGVRAEPNTKRVYPQDTLAAQVIGHTSYDGDGIYGLEAYYDDYLAGIDGRVITASDRQGNEMPYRYKQSYDAQDGNSLNLNIDINIQYMLEKYLVEAYEQNKPKERLCSIIMNPKTGQVYAMATLNSYDPNDPSAITDKAALERLAALKEGTAEYDEAQLTEWSTQWKNKCVSELYNPGSVFKIITASSALEEKAITLEDTFNCGTHIQVDDADIHCWSDISHGSQNLALAMLNSCNPAFVQIGLRLGTDNFLKYFDGFGYNELTGIDLPGEINSYNIHMLSSISSVDLATSSFGQNNKVTPIQMIVGASAAINGGYVVTPQVVDSIVDKNGNILKKNQPVIKRQIISEETSATMREILKGVVEGQKGSNSYVPGYSIGGKSGTSQKMDVDRTGNTYVSSYCAFAPAEDPEIIMLLMVDDPQGGKYYGSQVAAPVCSQVLSEVLPYLGYFPEYTEEELATISVSVPNVEQATVAEAVAALNDAGLEGRIVGDGDIVLKQVPGVSKVEHGGSVVLYTERTSEVEKVTVPSLQGLTREQARYAVNSVGLNLTVIGSAAGDDNAVGQADQSIAAGNEVPVGTSITVTFAPNTVGSW